MKYALLFLSVLMLMGCKSEKPKPYSFFVAGHTYGSPVDYKGGLYAPFVSHFPSMNADSALKMGFFTGDIVQKSTPENWQSVKDDLEGIERLDLHFIPGNHDVRDNNLFDTTFPNRDAFFEYQEDAFILLDGNIDQWNITGDQLLFLKSSLDGLDQNVNNVFIFVHQLIFSDLFPIDPNSWEGKADTLNFESEILPLLEATGKPVYLFSGDVGGVNWGISLFHEKSNNITYLASGMGGENGDNYLKVNVREDKSVSIEIVSLDGTEFGPITDY